MESDKRKFYLEQVGNAAKRSRLIFYLLLFSAALIFCFDWKMHPSNWLRQRIEIRHRVLTHWDALASNQPPAGLPAPEWARLQEALKRMRFDAGAELDQGILRDQLRHLDQQWNDTFKVPLMDATFDINDFVFFSTLELLVLTLVFVYCLMREAENLRLSFVTMKREGTEELREFYEMASMQQVWTVPQAGATTVPVLRHLPSVLLLVPLAIMWWVFIRDRLDAGAGKVLNETLALWVVSLEYVSLALLTIVTAFAIRYFLRISATWDEAKAHLDHPVSVREVQPI